MRLDSNKQPVAAPLGALLPNSSGTYMLFHTNADAVVTDYFSNSLCAVLKRVRQYGSSVFYDPGQCRRHIPCAGSSRQQ